MRLTRATAAFGVMILCAFSVSAGFAAGATADLSAGIAQSEVRVFNGNNSGETDLKNPGSLNRGQAEMAYLPAMLPSTPTGSAPTTGPTTGPSTSPSPTTGTATGTAPTTGPATSPSPTTSPATSPTTSPATTPLPTNTTGAGTPTNSPLPTNTNTPVPADTNTPIPTNTTGAGTPTNSPLPTNTNTPVPADTNTPLPTNTTGAGTPTNSPLPTETSEPTETPAEGGLTTGIELDKPSGDYKGGETMKVTLTIINTGPDINADVYLVIEVGGTFYSFPDYTPNIAGIPVLLPNGMNFHGNVAALAIPNGVSGISGMWHFAVTERGTFNIVPNGHAYASFSIQ